MSKSDTLFGVALGALIVGATLTVEKIMNDPEKAECLRAKAEKTCRAVGDKVKEGCDLLGKKLAEGGAVVREKASAATDTVREKASEKYNAVRGKAKEGYDAVREKAKEGYAAVRERVEETGDHIRSTIEESAAARKIKKKIGEIRRAAEPVEEYFRDEMENDSEEEASLPAEEA